MKSEKEMLDVLDKIKVNYDTFLKDVKKLVDSCDKIKVKHEDYYARCVFLESLAKVREYLKEE